MSVYTTVKDGEMRAFLRDYDLGALISHKGIQGGVTNTNYFVDTLRGRFVLTLFETLRADELPFFMRLQDHLNRRGVACPAPVPRTGGGFVGKLCGKPAVMVTCLNGADVAAPNVPQCFAVGAMLARMHSASLDFSESMPNPRGFAWFEKTAELLAEVMDPADAALLRDELDYLRRNLPRGLPQGIIHADLFRDNVLMYYDDVAGFIDFYYACSGSFVYDLAIALNDWARDDQIYALNPALGNAMMNGYESVRPLAPVEHIALPVARRAAAVRFWLSRLLDFHFPAPGELTFTKDPQVFRNLLLGLHREG